MGVEKRYALPLYSNQFFLLKFTFRKYKIVYEKLYDFIINYFQVCYLIRQATFWDIMWQYEKIITSFEFCILNLLFMLNRLMDGAKLKYVPMVHFEYYSRWPPQGWLKAITLHQVWLEPSSFYQNVCYSDSRPHIKVNDSSK